MSAPVPRRTVIAVVVATTVAQAATTMGIAAFPVIAPPLAQELGVAPASIGYLVSLAFGTAAFASPFMSFAIPRWGACRATQVGLIVSALAMAFAVSATYAGLALCALLLGLGMTLMTPASGHLLFRFSPAENRNLIFSIKQTGVPLGWVAMAVIAPAVTVSFGWRWATAVVLAVFVLTAAILERVRAHWDDDRTPAAAGSASAAAGLRILWRYPVLRWLSVSAMCLSFVQLCVATFLVTMLVAEGGYSLVAAGVMLALVQGAGVAGRVLWGWWGDRTGDSLGVLRKIAATTAACCVATAFLGPGWPLAVLVLFFVIYGLTAVGWNGLFLAEVAHSAPRGMVSVATSAAMVWNFGGILIGPALFAATYGITASYTLTYGLMSIVAATAVVFLTFARLAPRHPRS